MSFGGKVYFQLCHFKIINTYEWQSRAHHWQLTAATCKFSEVITCQPALEASPVDLSVCMKLRRWQTDSSLTFTPHFTLQSLCRYSLTRTVTTTRDRSSCRRRRRRRRRWRMRRWRRRRPAVFGFLCYAHQLLASLVRPKHCISTHIVSDWLCKEGTRLDNTFILTWELQKYFGKVLIFHRDGPSFFSLTLLC